MDFKYSEYEMCFSIDPLITQAKKLTEEGLKVAVFLDMDRTITRGIISDPNYQLKPEDLRNGIYSGIETMIEKGCLVSILTARGNGEKIEHDGNFLLNRYPVDLARVLGPLWKSHKAFNFGNDFVSKPLIVDGLTMKGEDSKPFHVTYDCREGNGGFIYGGGKQKKDNEYGVKGGVIVSLIKENALKFNPDVILFGDNAAFNIYEVRLTLEKHCIKSKVFHIPNMPGTQQDRPDPLSSRFHGDDIVFSSWEELVISKGQ